MNQNTLLPFSLSPLLVSLFALFTPFTTHAAGPAGLPGPGQLPADVAGQFKLERDVPGKSLTVTQERQGVLVDWNKLGVGASEVLNFVAKNPAANVSQWFTVNRVTGGQESTILGTVNAPWRIFLINPNGIVFGPGSSMNVGALVASTLKLGNADTLLADGEAQFELPTGTVAELRFEGTVQASDTVFVGPKVRFDGVVHPSVNAGAPNSANVYILATDSANIATTGTPVADGSPDESLRFLAVTDAGLELLKLVIQRSGNGTYSALNVPDVPAPGKLEVRNGNVFVQYAPASPVQVGQVATHTLVAQADATTSLVVNTQSNLLNSSISNAHSATTTAGGSAGLSTTDVTTVDATGTTGLSLTATRASQISGKTTGLGANVQINLTDADSANITSTGNITGTATDTSNTAGDALILNAEGTIGVTANHIQIAQLTTAGNILSSSISNASSATLHAGGDILGSSVSNASIASLVAGNDVNASANHVDTLSINAGQSIEFGQSRTIGKLTAVAQNAITQTGDVRVSGSDSPAILSANSIVLGNNGNVFAGGVLVQQHTAGQSATVHALGNLNARLNGQYSTVDLQAGNTLNADFQQADQAEVAGNTVNLSSTTNQLNIGTSLKVQADSGFDLQTTLHNAGSTRIAAQNARVLQADSTFDGLFNVILAGGRLDFAATGNVNLALSGANAADIRLSRGSLHQAADASGVVEVGGPFLVNVTNGNIDLTNPGNHFTGQVQLFGDQTSLSTQGDLNLAALQTKGGVVSAAQRLFLTGNIVQTGGALAFVAAGAGSDTGLQTAADLVLPELDVFTGKEGFDANQVLQRVLFANASIVQTGGSIENTANSSLFFQSTANGSIVLNQNNRMVGSFNALSGNNYREPYQFKPQFGQSVVSITNASGLKVGNPGIDSDIVVIQAPSLATGAGGQVRARLPYNDKLLGESHSFPAMVLAVAQPVAAGFTLQDNQNEIVNGGQFQEISVEVGAPNTEELGGFLTVLPFKGSTLRPGQVVFLIGPQASNLYSFFYDGAGNPIRIPVSYNGFIPRSPSEGSTLTTIFGESAQARQREVRSAVRTESVADRLVNGVIAELGKGKPATEGGGGLKKPDSCESSEQGGC